MRKINILMAALTLAANAIAIAQNLVINPGLESYITCPGFGQFGNTYINNWTKPSWGSTDYYHTNCTGIQPVSQVPHGGDAYFGVIAYNFGTEYREYATGELLSPLIAGKQYIVEFYVSLNDGYIQAVKEMGAYFSATPPGPYANSLHIPVTPHVENNSGTLGSTSTWMPVTGTFTAAGGELYITIGNFRDDLTTTVTMVGTSGSFGAYYFVDDVSVISVPEGVEENSPGQLFVYPNPVKDFAIVNGNALHIGKLKIKLVNIIGNEILIPADKISWTENRSLIIDLKNISEGVYFLNIEVNGNVLNKKIIKTGK